MIKGQSCQARSGKLQVHPSKIFQALVLPPKIKKIKKDSLLVLDSVCRGGDVGHLGCLLNRGSVIPGYQPSSHTPLQPQRDLYAMRTGQ